MPFVNIQILEGRTPDVKARIAARVTAAVSEETGIPLQSIWVVFEDVSRDDWFVAGTSVRAQTKPETAKPETAKPEAAKP